jgi:hypothetical protein
MFVIRDEKIFLTLNIFCFQRSSWLIPAPINLFFNYLEEAQ